MCEWNKYGDTRIDPCMRQFVKDQQGILRDHLVIRMCCCGHKRHPTTIVLFNKDTGVYFEMLSGKILNRQGKFYKRDKQGVYYIPEVSKEKK